MLILTDTHRHTHKHIQTGKQTECRWSAMLILTDTHRHTHKHIQTGKQTDRQTDVQTSLLTIAFVNLYVTFSLLDSLHPRVVKIRCRT